MRFRRRHRAHYGGQVTAAFLCLLGLFVSAKAQTSPQNSPDPVTFVAWNLKNYLAMERRVDGEVVSDAPKPEKEIEVLVAAIVEAKPDILGVCEIGDAAYLADLQKRLKAKGLELPHTELVISADGWNRNLALLSRFPIVSRDPQTDLTYLIGQTRFPIQRGILDVTLAINDSYRLRCLGLHLKSKREIPEADQAEMRRNEAHLIREHLDSIMATEPGTNLIVYGDFNDTPNEIPIRTIRGRFGSDDYLTDLRPNDRFGFRWTHYWSVADTYARLDYTLVSKGLLPEVDRDSASILHPEDWETASDHRGLRFQFTPKDLSKSKK
ncbi:MAG: endonuclease/exonuclease/phosphatase family protein [Verrucomicrobiae bacterium]|nr:endonuclease/exonuclease/phosphatase family protein [Verrucomicrobiae bacterium]